MTDDIYRRPAREWPIPPMDKEAGWKDSAFTWAMGRLILQRIADGDTMKEITADPRMPAYCTVFRWMQVVPEFGTAVDDVRARLAELRQAERDAQRRARGPRRRSGRRSTLTAERAGRLLAELRSGASLSEVVEQPGAPSFRVIYCARWDSALASGRRSSTAATGATAGCGSRRSWWRTKCSRSALPVRTPRSGR